MPKKYICIAGKNEIAVDALLFIIERGWKDRLMICPNKSDNGQSSWQPSLIRFATEFNIPIITLDQAQKIRDLIFISLEFDRIIHPASFQTQRLYNIHFSALPAYKGMYTSALPLLHGRAISGVTLHEIDHGIDTGAIIAQHLFEIKESWRARDLYFAYMQHGFELFCAEFDRLIMKDLPESHHQSPQNSTYFSKSSIDYKNISINLRDTADGIIRQLRAFSFREYQIPEIGGMNIGNWYILPERSIEKPGTILQKNNDQMIVASIDYNILLTRFKDWDWFNLKHTNSIDQFDARYIDVSDTMGWTPLIRAAFAGDLVLCQRLLENGADPNKSNSNGTTPLMYALSSKQSQQSLKLANILINFGADRNRPDRFGRTLKSYHPSAVLEGDQ